MISIMLPVVMPAMVPAWVAVLVVVVGAPSRVLRAVATLNLLPRERPAPISIPCRGRSMPKSANSIQASGARVRENLVPAVGKA